MARQRAQWGSRLGFVLAAAGSAIGLGNIWRFPYITGENGGGWFVIIYLLCIALVGLPIMMAEIFIGRTAQNSPVGAFRSLSRPGSLWMGVGWMGILTGFIILSFYSVVAGWSLHYVWLSLSNGFADRTPDQIGAMFGSLFENPTANVAWHAVFMAMTIMIVIGGVRNGVERAAQIMMPALFLMMLALLVKGALSDGFGESVRFVFGLHAEDLTSVGVLEALGQAFFTLSLGMGAMITYGSYLKRDDDLVSTSIQVTVLDTAIALMACLVIFPIIFTHAQEPASGPGLVFVNVPIAFSGMAGGAIWATVFFLLLTFAALTSSISLLEVVVSYFIDERGWSRRAATVFCGLAALLLGIPSALSGGTKLFGSWFQTLTDPIPTFGEGKNWFDTMDFLTSSWLLPLGGLGIAMFVAWRVGGVAREQGFRAGTKFGKLYWGWIFLLRFIVPIGVIAVFLNALGLFTVLGLTE